MGGGDLNSKKSWHPNTMKNQERVWKAEQAAAEEKKRITELQREHTEEKERAELKEMAQRNSGLSNDSRLNWMYDKPDKKAQEEDYLLGKSIEKNYNHAEKEDNVIPAVARRVVGSSMVSSAEDTQVDLARKVREDPLLLVKERERAARAALLNNPVHRKRLADLLRKEQEEKKEKTKKKSKKKDLDNMLAAKLSVLGEKGIDIAKLLASDDSSSNSEDSSDNRSKNKKKRKEKHKKKDKEAKAKKKSKKVSSDSSDASDDERDKKKHKSSDKPHHSGKTESRKSRRDSDSTDHEISKKKRREDTRTETKTKKSDEKRSQHTGTRDKEHYRNKDDRYQSGKARYHSDSYDKYKERDRQRDKSPNYQKGQSEREKRSKGLSDKEKAARLAEMMAAGAEREVLRGRRVAEQRRADAVAEQTPRVSLSAKSEARALPESLESRIHSNRHYIQRDRQHMNQHFARR